MNAYTFKIEKIQNAKAGDYDELVIALGGCFNLDLESVVYPIVEDFATKEGMYISIARSPLSLDMFRRKVEEAGFTISIVDLDYEQPTQSIVKGEIVTHNTYKSWIL